ncbi:hypothetical protein TSUD_174930 [Trifolium subterraneum]|uniref:SNF2 N-terminal domain-containing protein n=1 Tax=Trifolium subterraneum TaxID=3900 RepID=A0A2Z6PF60_TRISU|nr:hypothetical protein TSUD_174930 [Trifolium subterraneum]
MAGGVSSRTRSKKVPLFHSPLPDSSSSKRRKNDEDVMSFDSASGSKRTRLKDEAFVFPENAEVISIDDEDGEGFKKQCEDKIDENGGSSEIGDKDGNFVDEKIGLDSENPIICSDESGESEEEEEEEGVKEGVKSDEISEFTDKDENLIVLDDSDESVNEDDDSDESDDDDDDDESEEDETSDEDFKVDELNEVSDDDDDDSYDDEGKKKRRMRKDFDVVEELEREVMDKESGVSVNNDEEKKKRGMRMRMRKDSDVVEEFVREVNDGQSGICQMKNEKNGSIINDEIELSDYCSVTNSTTFEKKGSFDQNKGCSSSSNKKEESKKQKAKSVENVSDVVSDSGEEKQQYGKRRWNNSVASKKQKENNAFNQRSISAYFTSKDLSLAKLLAECYSDKKNSLKNGPIGLEVNGDNDDDDDDDDVDPRDTQKPPVCVETPLIWSLKKVQTVELTEEEEEERRNNEALNPIWDEMFMCINESEAESKIFNEICKEKSATLINLVCYLQIGNLGTNEATQETNGSSSSRCEHNTIYDEEIGVYCKSCGERDKYPYEGYEKGASSEDSGNASRFDYSKFNASDGDLDANFSHKKGTVWDLIPEVKETLYPHQQEGFEVIWKNLAGSINRRKLKNADPDREGGCIISHAPGTGKTRLTIVFLMAYLKVFPKCFPVIVAPKGLLLTWEDEFRKWNIGVPFHNLNNPELSGKEHEDAVNELNWSSAQHTTVDTRMVKLISWYKETSILGISYTLYKKLAGAVESEDEGGESENEKTKNQASVEKRKEMGKFLHPRVIWLGAIIALFSLCYRYGCMSQGQVRLCSGLKPFLLLVPLSCLWLWRVIPVHCIFGWRRVMACSTSLTRPANFSDFSSHYCHQGSISQGLVRMLRFEAFSASCAFELLVTLARDPLVAYHRLE